MKDSLYLASETIRCISAIQEALCSIWYYGWHLRAIFRTFPTEERLEGIHRVAQDAERLWDEVIALSELYSKYDQELDSEGVISIANQIGDTLHRVEKLTGLLRTYGESRYLQKESMETLDRLISELRTLKERVKFLSQTTADSILAMLPIPLSEAMTGKITHEQIRLNPQAAIQHAFSVFEEHLRSKIEAGADTYGQPLINRAFGSNGCLVYGELQSEREGVRNLMAGAYAVLRNPRDHRILEDNEVIALATVALVDLLVQIVDEAEKVKSQGAEP